MLYLKHLKPFAYSFKETYPFNVPGKNFECFGSDSIINCGFDITCKNMITSNHVDTVELCKFKTELRKHI